MWTLRNIGALDLTIGGLPMSQKRVKFNHQINSSGESDVRAEIEETETKKTEPQPTKVEIALEQLKALGEFMRNKKEDDLHRDYKINRIHIHLIAELYGRQYAGKELYLSDGQCELIDLLHERLKSRF